VNDQDAWIAGDAAQACHVLADPAVDAAARCSAPTTVASSERGAGTARRELAGLQARWPLLEEDEHEP
jgi:hypothetical protein